MLDFNEIRKKNGVLTTTNAGSKLDFDRIRLLDMPKAQTTPKLTPQMVSALQQQKAEAQAKLNQKPTMQQMIMLARNGDTRTLDERYRDNLKEAGTKTGAFAQHLANTTSFNLARNIGGEKAQQTLDISKKTHPISSLAGEITGYLMPGVGLERAAYSVGTKLASKSGLTAAAGKLLSGNSLKSQIARGAAAGATQETALGYNEGASAKEIAARVGMATVGGAALDVGLNKLAKVLKARFGNRVPTEDEIVQVAQEHDVEPDQVKSLLDTMRESAGIDTPEGMAKVKSGITGFNNRNVDYGNRARELMGFPLLRGKGIIPTGAKNATVQADAPESLYLPEKPVFEPPVPQFKSFGENTVGAAAYSKSMEYPDKLPVSKFRTNTLEKALPEEAKAQLNLEDFDYVPETKAEWQKEAMHNIATDREKVIQDIKDAKSISGGVQAHEAAILSHDLLVGAQQTGDYSKYRAFLQTVADKTRESARALKGTDTAWDKMSADGAVMQAKRTVDKGEKDVFDKNPKLKDKIKSETDKRFKELTDFGENPDYDKVRDFVKKRYGIPVLEDDDIKFIVDNMNESKKYPPGSYENRMFIARAKTHIANMEKSDFIEKFKALQRMAMLSNPKTLVARNPVGNVLIGALEDVKNIPATVLDMGISKVTGKRTTTINPIKARANLQGMVTGLKEYALDIKNNVDTSPTKGKMDLPNKTIIFNENHNISNKALKNTLDTVGKAGNFTHSIVARLLQLGDRPFYQGAYKARLAELKLLNKTDTVTEDMMKDAREHALERTFQNDSWLANKMLKWGTKRDTPADVVWSFIVNLFVPFKQTPANILDKFIDYSGVGGAAKGLTHLATTAGKGTFNQKYFVDTMGRALTGTGLMTVGYLLAQKGVVTGAPDRNNKIEGIETALGAQNYAYKVGDEYHTYNWALPAAAPIALGADFYYAMSKAKDGQIPALKGTESAVNLIFRSTMLQGIMNLTSGYSPAEGIGKALLNSTTQLTPTAGKQIAQLMDPYARETYDPNAFKQALNKNIVKIPGASKTLPRKQDVFGNDVKYYQGKNNLYNVMLNPGFDTTYKPDATQKEVMRLYKDSGLTDQLPAVAEKYLDATKDHPRINLTTEEYVQYQKDIGQRTMTKFKQVMALQGYKAMNDTDRAAVLETIVKNAKEDAKNKILKARGYVKAELTKADKKQKQQSSKQKQLLLKKVGEK